MKEEKTVYYYLKYGGHVLRQVMAQGIPIAGLLVIFAPWIARNQYPTIWVFAFLFANVGMLLQAMKEEENYRKGRSSSEKGSE